ncbi:sensor histidine kinase [Deefgea rivuli]|uniref:sensor histidine kinase n=1 Tax=Deefgea rivuli TaxID=400948 RepID=UPI00048025F0|nr:HAMP domain-containing sensor histidine kinase [Deefgea rivuli]
MLQSPILWLPAQLEAELATLSSLFNTDKMQLRERGLALLNAARQARHNKVFIATAELYCQEITGEASRNLLFEALQLAQHLHDFVAEMRLSEQIARNHYMNAQYRLALQYWQRTTDLAEQLGDQPSGLIYGRVGMGQVYDALGQHHQAVHLHTQALAILPQVIDVFLEAKVRINLGVNLAPIGETEAAAHHLRLALGLCLENEIYDYAAEAQFRLGELGLENNLFELAGHDLAAARQLAQKVGYQWAETGIIARQAELLAKLGAPAEALVIAREGLKIAERIHYRDQMMRLNAAAARYCEMQGDIAQAYPHLKAQVQALEQIQSEASQSREQEHQHAVLSPDTAKRIASLANHPLLEAGEASAAFALILREACDILQLSAASWRQYLSGQWRMIWQTPLPMRAEWPASTAAGFLNCHQQGWMVIAHDARHHPLTWPLCEPTVNPDLFSLLAVPVHVASRPASFLVLEHANEQHNWTPDEILYAGMLADMAARIETLQHRVQLSEQIQTLNAELIQANQELEARVERRTLQLKKANQELEQAMAKLVQIEKMAALGHLVAGIAHELNTPLGVATTAVSLLNEEVSHLLAQLGSGTIARNATMKSLQHVQEAGALLDKNIVRASHLVQSFQQIVIDPNGESLQTIRLRELCIEVLALCRNQGEIGIDFIVDIPAELVLTTRRAALRQILLQLINNAIKHGFAMLPTHPKITLQAVAEGGKVQLSVADNGCGIAQKHLAQVFNPFFTTHFGQGSGGLGLYMVFNLVTSLLGGGIRLESSLNEGSKFILDIPSLDPAE